MSYNKEQYQTITKPLRPTTNPAHIDYRYGVYNNKAEALEAIPYSLRAMGLTVGIKDSNGAIEEYWWKHGVEDQNLEKKQVSTNTTTTINNGISEGKFRELFIDLFTDKVANYQFIDTLPKPPHTLMGIIQGLILEVQQLTTEVAELKNKSVDLTPYQKKLSTYRELAYISETGDIPTIEELGLEPHDEPTVLVAGEIHQYIERKGWMLWTHKAGIYKDGNNKDVYFLSNGSEVYQISGGENGTIVLPTKTLTSLELTSKPSKTLYVVGETIHLSGAVVNAIYSDGSRKNIPISTNSLTYKKVAGQVTGKEEITLSYTEGGVTVSTSFTIFVSTEQEPPTPPTPSKPTIYYGTTDKVPSTEGEIKAQKSTESLEFTSSIKMSKKNIFIAYPTKLRLVQVENAGFKNDFWYNDTNQDGNITEGEFNHFTETQMSINGVPYIIKNMTAFYPLNNYFKVKLINI